MRNQTRSAYGSSSSLGYIKLRCAFGAGIPGYLHRFFAMKLFFVGKNKIIVGFEVRLVRQYKVIPIDFSLRNGGQYGW